MEKITLNNEFFLYKSTSDKYVIFVHGMVETMDGYVKIKDYLVDNGINVILYNNRGHGENSKNFAHLNVYESYKLVGDLIDIEKYVKENFNPSEVVIVGHSMGTAIVRAAMKTTKFDKVVLNGASSSISPIFSNILLFIYLFINDKKTSKLFNKIVFNSFNNTVENPKSENDWVCSNAEYIQSYNDDPYSGFIGTGGFYQEVIRLSAMAREIDILPTRVMLTSGKCDPVTKMGENIDGLAKKLSKQGCECTSILYDNMRHFIYDEVGCDICYVDLLSFINKE